MYSRKENGEDKEHVQIDKTWRQEKKKQNSE